MVTRREVERREQRYHVVSDHHSRCSSQYGRWRVVAVSKSEPLPPTLLELMVPTTGTALLGTVSGPVTQSQMALASAPVLVPIAVRDLYVRYKYPFAPS